VSEKPRKFVYFFGDGSAEGNARMRDTLGGKGAGLADMSSAGLPVPPGYTITTEACRQFFEAGGRLLDSVVAEEEKALRRLERLLGRRLGDPENPLLLSVRSGSPVSMPGMMDTVLNLGLNDATVEGLARKSGNPRFAYDSYRRFIQMFSDVVLGIPRPILEGELTRAKRSARVASDVDLNAERLQALVLRLKQAVRHEIGRDFTQDARAQLSEARDAVFRSWNTDRAAHYRKLNGIPETLGTAVNVQAMVFGNLGATSATGVGFTRDPATGEPRFYGEYLRNAQGEDVVAGIRTPRPIEEMEQELPEAYAELREITTRLERHYRDIQDFEFTVEEGRLFMLQTRRGQRTGMAALRIAVDMVDEGLLSKREGIERVEPERHRRTRERRDPVIGHRRRPGRRAGRGGQRRRRGPAGRPRPRARAPVPVQDVHGHRELISSRNRRHGRGAAPRGHGGRPGHRGPRSGLPPRGDKPRRSGARGRGRSPCLSGPCP